MEENAKDTMKMVSEPTFWIVLLSQIGIYGSFLVGYMQMPVTIGLVGGILLASSFPTSFFWGFFGAVKKRRALRRISGGRR